MAGAARHAAVHATGDGGAGGDAGHSEHTTRSRTDHQTWRYRVGRSGQTATATTIAHAAVTAAVAAASSYRSDGAMTARVGTAIATGDQPGRSNSLAKQDVGLHRSSFCPHRESQSA